MKCKKCGKALPDTAKFCRHCGAENIESAPAAAEDEGTVFMDVPSLGAASAAAEDEGTVFMGSPSSGAAPAAAEDEGTVFMGSLSLGAAAPITPVKPASPPAVGQNKQIALTKKKSMAPVIVIITVIIAAAAAALYFMFNGRGDNLAKLEQNALAGIAGDNLQLTRTACEECIAMGTDMPEIYLALAEIYYENGEQENAVELLKTGYKRTGNNEIWDMLTYYEEEIALNKKEN